MSLSKMFALVIYEFKGRNSLRSDLIGLLILVILSSFRFLGDFIEVQNEDPNVGLLTDSFDLSLTSDLQGFSLDNDIAFFSNRDSAFNELDFGGIDYLLDICTECQVPTMIVYSNSEDSEIKFIDNMKPTLDRLVLPRLLDLDQDVFNTIDRGLFVDKSRLISNDFSNFYLLNFFILLLIIMSALSGFNTMLQSITEEKNSYVFNMYMSSLKPGEWLDSKVLAASLLSLKSFFLYLSLGLIVLIYSGFLDLSYKDILMFLVDKFFYLCIALVIGFFFWMYFFAFICTLLNSATSSVRGAAVVVPMAFFMIVAPRVNDMDSFLFDFFMTFPFTFLFAQASAVVIDDFSLIFLIFNSSFSVASILLLRFISIRNL